MIVSYPLWCSSLPSIFSAIKSQWIRQTLRLLSLFQGWTLDVSVFNCACSGRRGKRLSMSRYLYCSHTSQYPLRINWGHWYHTRRGRSLNLGWTAAGQPVEASMMSWNILKWSGTFVLRFFHMNVLNGALQLVTLLQRTESYRCLWQTL